MMAAIIAVMLILQRTAQMAWDLAQLRQYVCWCERTLQCAFIGKRLVFAEEGLDGIKLMLENKGLADELKGNSDIVDNELNDRDVSLSISWGEWGMEVDEIEVCTVRWAAALLCSFGHKLGVQKCSHSTAILLISWVYLQYCIPIS